MEQSQISGGIGGAAQGAAIGAQFGGPWGAAIGGVIGGVAGIFGGGGEDDAKELARTQANRIKMQGQRDLMQMRKQMNQTVGAARAGVGASNILFEGTADDYISAMSNEFESALGWQRTKTKIDQQIALKGGDMAANQIQNAGISSAIGGLGSLATAYGKNPSAFGKG